MTCLGNIIVISTMFVVLISVQTAAAQGKKNQKFSNHLMTPDRALAD